MTKTKLHTCGDCAFNSVGYCMRNRMAVKPINYACRHFMTPEDRAHHKEIVSLMEKNMNKLRQATA